MPPATQPAGLARRLAAGGYDLLVLAGVLVATSFAVVIARGGRAVPTGDLGYQAFLLTQAAGYYILFWSRGGQTPGMRAWGIRVETVAGAAMTARTAALRFPAMLLSAGTFGLGFAWALTDRQRRTWHDRWSGTRVVRVAVSGRAAAPRPSPPRATP
jgi:uncharacterized RDD family membrane protein YckC